MCKLSVPFLKWHLFFTEFWADKSAKTHGNSPPDVHLSTDNSAGKFHLSVIKISRVRQVGHGISTTLVLSIFEWPFYTGFTVS